MATSSLHGILVLGASIAEICLEKPWIVAAWLFGSVGRGTAGPGSDIDVAVLADKTMAEVPVLSLISELERKTGRQVDVVLLNRAGDLLRYEVRRHGRLIFERVPRARKDFEISGRKSFEDFLHLHRRYVAKVLYGGKCG